MGTEIVKVWDGFDSGKKETREKSAQVSNTRVGVAEGVGFEPTSDLRHWRFSRPLP